MIAYLDNLSVTEILEIATYYFQYGIDDNTKINKANRLITVTNSQLEKIKIQPFCIIYLENANFQFPDKGTIQEPFLDFMLDKYGTQYLWDKYDTELRIPEKENELQTLKDKSCDLVKTYLQRKSTRDVQKTQLMEK